MKVKALVLLAMFYTVAAYADVVDNIREAIERSGLNAPVEEVVSGPMPGIYTLKLEGGRVLYTSENGEYFIQGRIHHFTGGKMVNVTAQQEMSGVSKAVRKVANDDMIRFSADNPQAEITVFTDTSCPFCHKLHEDMDELNEAGITVRYLAYPRQGLKSEAYETMVSVWCSANRQEALSEAIDDDDVDAEDCDNPVKDQFRLGQLIGVKGTPTIIFQDGSLVSGYRSPEVIIKAAKAAAQNDQFKTR